MNLTREQLEYIHVMLHTRWVHALDSIRELDALVKWYPGSDDVLKRIRQRNVLRAEADKLQDIMNTVNEMVKEVKE